MIFENGQFKGYLEKVGWVDPDRCIQSVEDKVWLTVNHISGRGTGLKLTEQCWYSLSSPRLALDCYLLDYAHSIMDMNIGSSTSYHEEITDLKIDDRGHAVATVSWKDEFNSHTFDGGDFEYSGEYYIDLDNPIRQLDRWPSSRYKQYHENYLELVQNGTSEQQRQAYKFLDKLFRMEDEKHTAELYNWYISYDFAEEEEEDIS